MTSPVRALLTVSESVRDIEGLRREVNRILALLQSGGLLLGGLRLDTQRVAVPTAAPEPGSPNLVLVDDAGTMTFYVWDGATWRVVGTQT
jgi:hypothetical protein